MSLNIHHPLWMIEHSEMPTLNAQTKNRKFDLEANSQFRELSKHIFIIQKFKV